MTFDLFHQIKQYSLLYPEQFPECTIEDIFRYVHTISPKEKGGLNHADNHCVSNSYICPQRNLSGK